MGGDHHAWGKELYFDASFYIPLIIRDPLSSADLARGSQVDAFTESVDLMPTLLNWLGTDIPAQCDGRSLLPFLQGQTPPQWRQEAHMELDFRDSPWSIFNAQSALQLSPDECQLAILRGRRWKYIHFAALPPLLFDLVADPHEMRNLAQDPAYQAVMLEMAQKLLSWRLLQQEHVLSNLHLGPLGLEDRSQRPG
jgi:arylsulfatase A-like enzyme